MMLRSTLSFLLVLCLLALGALSASAQNGGQTLADIMARQRGEIVTNDTGTTDGAPSTAPSITGPLGPLGGASDADLWRNLRGAAPTDIFAPQSEDQVMQRSGQAWRTLRENYIRKYAVYFPGAVILILILYHLVRGKMRISGGFSGKTLPRFTLTHRVAHWFMACVFMLLGLSGLIILLGRPLLAPLIGREANSILTSAAMQGHNLFGPIFIIALFWIFVKFVRGNFFQWVDFKWILKLGGIFGGHVSSSQFNFGEKSWFWMVVLVGIVISATGILMEFPWLAEDLRLHQLATVLHAIGAILLISVSFGHIYLGTVGMEGSIDSMLKGEVDENWAKEHHDLWYEEMTGKSATEETE